MEKISLWHATAQQVSFTPLNGDETADVAIIGGGITGVTAAYLLSQQGKSVILLESEKIGESATGYSTGNLYALTDSRLSHIESSFSEKTARRVAESRSQAVNLIEELAGTYAIDCDFARQPWTLFTETKDKIPAIEKEYSAAEKAGLLCSLKDSLPLAFPVLKAVKVENQAQFNPMAYVKGLAKKILSDRCRIYEHTRVEEIKKGNSLELITQGGRVHAGKVILATHTPVGVYGLHSVLFPYREDAIAVKLTDDNYPPGGIFWGLTGSHHHSIRTYVRNGEKYLVVVGETYKTGQANDASKKFKQLEEFARERFHINEVAYRWAAQSYRSKDGLPYIGEIEDNIFTGTGFSTDGLTYGTLSAMIMADLINGQENKWSDMYDIHRHNLKGLGKVIKEGLNVAAQYLKDLPGMDDAGKLDNIKPGEGKVLADRSEKIAVYRDENNHLHAVSAVCTHMECIVNWNGAEKTWDCPCHGSRFKINGEVIEGPAFKPLADKTDVIQKIK